MATRTIDRVASSDTHEAIPVTAYGETQNRITALLRWSNTVQGYQRAKRSSRWPLRVGLASTKGRRPANEDRVYANSDRGLFIVADGIGGYFGGGLASQLLIDTAAPLLAAPMLDDTLSHECVQDRVLAAVHSAHQAMRELANSDLRLMKMGSTVEIALIIDRTLYVAHVGDSRVYLVRQNTITQITKDQTLVQALLDAGALTQEAAKRSMFRHVILDSVNAVEPSQAEFYRLELMAGDRLLLTTDGLTDFVEEADLLWTATHIRDPQFASNLLVHEALANKSKDNVTCLLVNVGRPLQTC